MIAHIMSVRTDGVVATMQPLTVVSIVDDDPDVRSATERLLKAHGFVARSFGSAEEFLGSPFVDRTGCLITDIRMPGMSGVELRDVLVARGHLQPVMFVTGHREEATLARALGPGDGFLTKPFDSATLVDFVDRAMSAARSSVCMSPVIPTG